VRVARAASAAAEVVFERRVALRDAGERGDRRRRERGAAEVRVQHDAGRIDDGRERRLGEFDHRRAHGRVPTLWWRRSAIVARGVDRGAGRLDDERARMGREQGRDAGTASSESTDGS